MSLCTLGLVFRSRAICQNSSAPSGLSQRCPDQLEQVVGCVDQSALSVHLLEASQQEEIQPPRTFGLAVHLVHASLAQSVDRLALELSLRCTRPLASRFRGVGTREGLGLPAVLLATGADVRI